jgi:hypothetical protein
LNVGLRDNANVNNAGLLLDPVYTAKAFAALVDDARSGAFEDGRAPVFVHTGGSPTVFSFASQMLAAGDAWTGRYRGTGKSLLAQGRGRSQP